MKKLGLSLVAAAGMFLFSQNAQAQVEEPEEMEEIEVIEEVQEDDYKAIDVLALPQAVKDAIMTDMNGAVAEEAWVKEDEGKNLYKLSLNVEGEKVEAYIDEEGSWIEKEEQ